MALKLNSVELTNIRSHKHIVFTPQESGITAIQGPNGAGKSTIVDSVAWCLYGTKPSGVSKGQDIFRAAAAPTDPAFVKLLLELDGRTLEVTRKRVNKYGAIELTVDELTPDPEGGEATRVNLAGPSVSHAEPFLRKLLHMDEKGFLASVLIQQKQVDQLIAASPRERGAVIEKLTGIAGLTVALSEAKQELNSLKKAVSFSSVDELGLEGLKEALEQAQKAAVQLKREKKEYHEQGKALEGKGLELKEQLSAVVKLREDHEALDRRLEELDTTLKLKNELLETALQEKQEAKKGLVLGSGSSESLKESLEEKSRQADALKLQLGALRKSITTNGQELKVLEKKLQGQPKLRQGAEVLETALQGKTQRLKEVTEEVVTLGSELQQLSTAIEVIGGGDSCPTCLQKVANVAVALKSLRSQETSTQESKANLEREAQELKKEQKELQGQLTLELELTAAEARLADLGLEQKELKQEEVTLESKLTPLLKELKVLREQEAELLRLEEKRRNYQKILSRAQGFTDDIEALEGEKLRCQEEKAALPAGDRREENRLTKLLEELRRDHNAKELAYTSATGDLKLKLQEISNLETTIAEREEAIAKHKALVKAVGVAAHSHEVIGEFRQERIKNSIPAIETYASELLNRFTEGKFTRLTLNEKFEATVYLADGTPRGVGLLSGGELSAAAIALRLAISMLLNSGADNNLLILDEVLVSQDQDRAELILNTLKEVSKGQVILIAHNDSIDSIADKIVSLKAPEK